MGSRAFSQQQQVVLETLHLVSICVSSCKPLSRHLCFALCVSSAVAILVNSLQSIMKGCVCHTQIMQCNKRHIRHWGPPVAAAVSSPKGLTGFTPPSSGSAQLCLKALHVNARIQDFRLASPVAQTNLGNQLSTNCHSTQTVNLMQH